MSLKLTTATGDRPSGHPGSMPASPISHGSYPIRSRLALITHRKPTAEYPASVLWAALPARARDPRVPPPPPPRPPASPPPFPRIPNIDGRVGARGPAPGSIAASLRPRGFPMARHQLGCTLTLTLTIALRAPPELDVSFVVSVPMSTQCRDRRAGPP